MKIYLAFLAVLPLFVQAAYSQENKWFRIEVRDAQCNWPVPLVELRTTDEQRFVSDNAGVIALDAPEMFGRETFFHIKGHGYEVDSDGFGYRGVRVTPQPGQSLTVQVNRKHIARRMGRLTGNGLLAESQKTGLRMDARESPLVGCDSVQLVPHDGKWLWCWGDTQLAFYPLGNFHMTGALTPGRPILQDQPPIEPQYEYLLNDKGRPRGMAPMPGKGPTWLTGFASLPDARGKQHLVATYRKIEGMLTTHEIGLCEWDEVIGQFKSLRKLWSKSDGMPEPTLLPVGHAVIYKSPENDRAALLMGDPLPSLSAMRATRHGVHLSDGMRIRHPTSCRMLPAAR